MSIIFAHYKKDNKLTAKLLRLCRLWDKPNESSWGCCLVWLCLLEPERNREGKAAWSEQAAAVSTDAHVKTSLFTCSLPLVCFLVIYPFCVRKKKKRKMPLCFHTNKAISNHFKFTHWAGLQADNGNDLPMYFISSLCICLCKHALFRQQWNQEI